MSEEYIAWDVEFLMNKMKQIQFLRIPWKIGFRGETSR